MSHVSAAGRWGWSITKRFEDWDAKRGSHFIFFTDDAFHRLQAVEQNSVAAGAPAHHRLDLVEISLRPTSHAQIAL